MTCYCRDINKTAEQNYAAAVTGESEALAPTTGMAL